MLHHFRLFVKYTRVVENHGMYITSPHFKKQLANVRLATSRSEFAAFQRFIEQKSSFGVHQVELIASADSAGRETVFQSEIVPEG